MRARRADVCRTAGAFPQSGSGSGSCGATLTCAWLGLAQNDSSVPSTVLSAVGCACGGYAAAFRASDIPSGACAKDSCARQVRAPRPRADASCDNRLIIIFLAIVRGAAAIKNLGQEAAPKVGPEMEHRVRKIASEECARQRKSRHARVNKHAPVKPYSHTFWQTNRQAHLHVTTRLNQQMSTHARKHTITQPHTRTMSHQPNTQTRR